MLLPERNLAWSSDFQGIYIKKCISCYTIQHCVSHVPSSMQNVLPSLALSPDDENEEDVTIQEKEKMINISYELAAEASKRSKVVAGTCARRELEAADGGDACGWTDATHVDSRVNSTEFFHIYFNLTILSPFNH